MPHYHGGEVSGEIEVGGFDVRHHGPAELGGVVGVVAQDPETQVVSTTVRGELELPLEIRGEPAAARARAVEEAALALAIPHLLDRTADSLSGGELQRVALAAALVGRPRLALLDEPTSQLDPVAGDELIGLLRRLNEEWGMAVVLAEHRLERCLSAADRVLAMAEGRIVFDGAPQDFLEWALASRPRSGHARRTALRCRRPAPPADLGEAARRTLAARAWRSGAPAGAGTKPESEVLPAGAAAQPGGRAAEAEPPRGRRPQVSDLWVELDDGRGPRDVLRGIDLSLDRGERVALMGRNGAGKTTLLRAAAGRLEPVRGRISAPGAARSWPRAPATSWFASGSPTSFPARRAAGRWPRWDLGGRRTPTRATCPAASASGWRSRW